MNMKSPALFLDRDGVINRDYGYVFESTRFDFYPEIFDICKAAIAANLLIVVVTNQSGIGRGFYTESEFKTLTEWMLSQFMGKGIQIALILHASENPELHNHETPTRRKPTPAMLIEAAQELNISLEDSIMIGDKETDMLAAREAGVSNRILISHESSAAATKVVASHSECLQFVLQLTTLIRKSK